MNDLPPNEQQKLTSSRLTRIRYQFAVTAQYHFQVSKEELLKRISRLPKNEVKDSFGNAEKLSINFDDCTDNATGHRRLRQKNSPASLLSSFSSSFISAMMIFEVSVLWTGHLCAIS